MTYDKQDLLLELRKLGTKPYDPKESHLAADAALLRFIDDEHVTAAYEDIRKWYS